MTDHLQPIRDLRTGLEQQHAELCSGIETALADIAQLRADRDAIAAQIGDLNRALGLRADGTPRKPRGEEAGSDANASADAGS